MSHCSKVETQAAFMFQTPQTLNFGRLIHAVLLLNVMDSDEDQALVAVIGDDSAWSGVQALLGGN